jgi:predicted dinucleotide-binding enzyme
VSVAAALADPAAVACLREADPAMALLIDAVLFYATDDDLAQAAVERLIIASGFGSGAAGGVDAALRIEMMGDLHQATERGGA